MVKVNVTNFKPDFSSSEDNSAGVNCGKSNGYGLNSLGSTTLFRLGKALLIEEKKSTSKLW